MLNAGTKAPLFELKNQFNNTVRLQDFLGKKVVLYFYPKDHTPGCTRQACAFRDSFEEFKNRDVVVLGISTDTHDAHLKFINDYNLPFNLLADPERKVVEDYEVWVEKVNFGNKYMGIERTTYIIDENGAIEKVFKKANPDTNAADILEYLDK